MDRLYIYISCVYGLQSECKPVPQKGQAVKRVAYTYVTYTPRVCVCVCGAKRKTKVAAGRQEGLLVARNQSGRHPGSQPAGAKNMLMSIILCVICFHASQAAPPPSLYLLCHYVPEYSYSYSHSHIYIRITCALIIS